MMTLNTRKGKASGLIQFDSECVSSCPYPLLWISGKREEKDKACLSYK
jgi:hypothetical protein